MKIFKNIHEVNYFELLWSVSGLAGLHLIVCNTAIATAVVDPKYGIQMPGCVNFIAEMYGKRSAGNFAKTLSTYAGAAHVFMSVELICQRGSCASCLFTLMRKYCILWIIYIILYVFAWNKKKIRSNSSKIF